MLKSLFYWLDLHPDTYWAVAFGPTIALLAWIGVRAWRESGDPAGRPRHGWIDAAALFLFLLAWRWPFLFVADELNPDESQLIAGAIALGHDPVFWRSVDGTTSGPLNFYALLPLRWLGLPLDYFVTRLAGLLVITGALFACLRTLAAGYGRALAWLGVLPAAAFFATVTHPDLTHFSSEHIPLVLIAVPAWLLATRTPDDRVRLWAALFIAGAAPWAKLQTAPVALVLCGWAAWQIFREANTPLRDRLLRLAAAVACALVPTLFFVGLTAATGQLENAFRRYFLHNFVYVQVGTRSVSEAVRDMKHMAMIDGRFPLLLVTVAGLLLAAVAYHAVRRVRPSTLFVVGALLTVAGIFAVIMPHREFLHYTLLLPVPFTLWLGAAAGGWWSDLATPRARRLLALGLLAAGALPPLLTRWQQPLPQISGSFSYHWRHPLSPIGSLVRGLSGREGTLGIWGWANHLYVETGLVQATRDAHSVWGIVDTPQRDYYRAIYLDDLRRHAPLVFVDAVGPKAFAFEHRSNAHEMFPALADYIREHYTLVRDTGEARIYVRKGTAILDNLSALKIDTLLAKGREKDRSHAVAPPLTPLEQLTYKEIGSRRVMMILPPTAVEWKLDDDVREVTLDFGFDPEAYERGDSNGAEIFVELVSFTNTRQIYRRLLDPKRQSADRGPQTARITLPPFSPNTHLVVRTGPGESNNNAWDWVYLEGVRFRHSPRFLSSQFPSFSRVPDVAVAEVSFLLGEGPEAQLHLHAPATLSFTLTGREQRLQFDYGFGPKSYTEGGQTDGASFRVELQEKGQPKRILFERPLDPARNPADRGTQHLDLALPADAGDARLIVVIDPGPAGNGAWDWTYLNNLTLQ